ncbi:MAG: hypothetical protein LBN95_12095 [Prevotellaceae bacterium]|jgi:hypothetical protein|nr:hypothetical protein [Prevotellaceae bacterium]
MKKIIFIPFFCLISLAIFSQSKIANKWSAEAMLGVGTEFEAGTWGLEYGVQINYSLLDRLGFYTSLGSFQSLFETSGIHKTNYSNLLWNLDIFGDIIRTQKGHRLRFAAGATYFKGALAFDSVSIGDEAGDYVVAWQAYYFNNIGINVNLSYICPLPKKWYLGVNLKAYDYVDGFFMQIATVGCSVGYNF